jgi:CubicO group peptidase (beta-lactamase class C family)
MHMANDSLLTVAVIAMLAGCVMAASARSQAAESEPPAGITPPLYDIPRLDGITIDGKDDDWARCGFLIDLLAPAQMPPRPATDFSARARLAWCGRGILMLVEVQDQQWAESPDMASLSKGDSVEVFLAPHLGDDSCCHWIISPGMADGQPEVRSQFREARIKQLRGYRMDIQAARTRRPDGYMLEVLLPFNALGLSPKEGDEMGLQFWVNDVDRSGSAAKATWHPKTDTHNRHWSMNRIRLAGRPSASAPAAPYGVAARVVGTVDFHRAVVNLDVLAPKAGAGKTVSLRQDQRVLGSAALEAAQTGYARASFALPLPPIGQSPKLIRLLMDGREADWCDLSDMDRMRAELFVREEPKASQYILAGEKLPEPAFEDGKYIEHLIGSYELKTACYDSRYIQVDKAERPGRYGAVTEIRLKDGRVFRRFTTLYRPSDAAVLKSAAQSQEAAIALAAGGGGSEADPFNSPSMENRRWWLGFKRGLYGWDKAYPKPFARPVKMEGEPARTIRAGTLAEAGMKSDAVARIDAELTEWSKNTDEAFAVCVARHGVIVLHKAYGRRGGEPMTVNTGSWMASGGKMFTGLLAMMAVDQGLMELDDLVGKFLPPLREVKTNKPFTLRRLLNHTSGVPSMGSQWAYEGDTEERIAVLGPHLKVGWAYVYTDTGMEVVGKVLEAVSGQTMPDLVKASLLDPLGCPNTFSPGGSGGGNSVPLDVAKILQMALNKGAYGPWRFFSEKAYEQMLPIPLPLELWREEPLVEGVGNHSCFHDGLSAKAFGHGAASGAILRVDPANDLVIVMTRSSQGKDYEKHQSRFIRAVVDGISE